jgi:uncharacterized protein (DUF427 family)
VIFNDVVLAETRQGKRVLETSHPPVYYIPAEDIQLNYLTETTRQTWCEWKGRCCYYDVVVNDRRANQAAWRYFDPSPTFVVLRNSWAFYAQAMDACYVDGELVDPQAGSFYGGWVTKDIVGPFKGGPGTMGW